MNPWDVLGWVLVVFIAVVALIIVLALVVSFVKSLTKPRVISQQIFKSGRDRDRLQ